MGIFDMFRRGRPDDTTDWVSDSSQTCRFCLDQASLNDVCLGDAFDRFRWLGPAEGRSKGGPPDDYYYFAQGLQVSASDGTVDHFILEFFQKPEWQGDPRFRAFAEEITHQGRQISLTPETTPEDLVSQIGEPNDHREQHGDSLSLHYSFNSATVSFDFVCDNEGKQVLHAVLVT